MVGTHSNGHTKHIISSLHFKIILSLQKSSWNSGRKKERKKNHNFLEFQQLLTVDQFVLPLTVHNTLFRRSLYF